MTMRIRIAAASDVGERVSAISDEAVAAKARELHDTGCGCPRGITPDAGWHDIARHELEQEALDADQAAIVMARLRDAARVRAELRDRIDHCREVGLDFEDIVRTLAHEAPDLVNAALDENEAPL